MNRTGYENLLQAVGICVSARIPALLWGDPGQGKTAAIESARGSGWHVETLIISHYEPSDFAGLPVLVDGRVELAPPAWAVRLRDHEGPAIAFFDEFSTASPALQAAALRPLAHYEVGALQLPPSVSFLAAANPADVAAAGWELAAPTASRFVHLEWELPLEVYSEALVTGQWPTMPVHAVPDDFEVHLLAQRVLVSGFLRARASQLSAIPKTAIDRGKAFPTPRTWDYAARLVALARAVDASDAVVRLLVAGCVGGAAAHEFLAWSAAQDLPDSLAILADPTGRWFAGARADHVYVTLQGVVGVATQAGTPEAWSAAVVACCTAASTVGVDPAVPAIRALLRTRPAAAPLPPEIKVFGSVLALAGLLSTPGSGAGGDACGSSAVRRWAPRVQLSTSVRRPVGKGERRRRRSTSCTSSSVREAASTTLPCRRPLRTSWVATRRR
ncbi:MAG: hypothetical protein Q4G46_16420 [Propionibacteriaceae bacterium]|nr:hypothetical protein [Propionibacteriaceae bacterium]